MATTARNQPRTRVPVAVLDLREVIFDVIGDALSVVLTAASISLNNANNHGFARRPEPIRLRRRSNDPIVSDPKTGKKSGNKAETRDAILTHDFRQRDRDLSA